jgi:hypothetical protein
VYVDTSRNGTRRFCSTSCQNRVKAAAFRARHAVTGARPATELARVISSPSRIQAVPDAQTTNVCRVGHAACGLHLGRPQRCWRSLRAVGGLGENPADQPVIRPGPVPQHVNQRAEARQRGHDHRFHGLHLPGAGAQRAAAMPSAAPMSDSASGAPRPRAADRQRSHQRRDFAELDQPGS